MAHVARRSPLFPSFLNVQGAFRRDAADSFCNWMLTGHRPFERRAPLPQQSLPDSPSPKNSPFQLSLPEPLVSYNSVELRRRRGEKIAAGRELYCITIQSFTLQYSTFPREVLCLAFVPVGYDENITPGDLQYVCKLWEWSDLWDAQMRFASQFLPFDM